MRNSGPALQRLFKAASLARQAPPAPLPAAVESKVLTAWRNTGMEDDFAHLVRLFRRAVAFAGVVMVLSIGWNWMETKNENKTESALAEYALAIQLPP